MEKAPSEKDPIQLESGDLGCPDCGVPLAKGPVPCSENGSLLGAFDGLYCPVCHYGVLSEIGYDDLGKAARNAGLVRETCHMDGEGKLVWENHSTQS